MLVMRDIMDGQLETLDEREIGRVDDILAEWRGDGSLVLTEALTGPQALTGRLSSRLRPLARFVLRDRFEHDVPLADVEECGPTLRLRRVAAEYETGQADQWVADHILRFIPGNGR